MSDVDLIAMKESHLPHVLAIERGSFRSPWSERLFRTELDRPEVADWFVALENGELVGYGGLLQVGPEGHITNLAVREDRRRRGIGRAILARLFAAAKERGIDSLTLEVRESNGAAIGLYESAGFHVVGRRKRYYPEDDEDALIMWSWDLL